jgi:glycosyltransferase involved in cell wall biosynthesis
MKIAVYTIALNEEAHCGRWANSVTEADYRIVLDTGSKDNTVQSLTDLGVSVYQQYINPWRFDVARNAALALVPTDADVCISMDMDEFMEPGWRQKIELAWSNNTTRLGYTYVFDYQAGADAQNGFYADKIHARHGYEWRRPVHETVFATSDIREIVGSDPNIFMNQIQDRSKPTRSNYLNLMKIAHEENPTDSQIAFWYGRELMYAKMHNESISIMGKYLELPTSIWKSERSEALLCLAKMDTANAWTYLIKATLEAPTRREVWNDVAQHCYNKQDWINLIWAALSGLTNSRMEGSYLDRKDAWNSQLADLGSIAAYYLGWKDKAIELIDIALSIDPDNERIKKNKALMM